MKKSLRRWATTVFIGVVAAIYCNFNIDSEDLILTSPRLPAAFDGTRIALLTDIHGGQLGPDSSTLLAEVRKAAPDYIALSGDLVDEDSDLSMLEPLLKGLADIAPTFYVSGNHEWRMDDPEDVFAKIGEHVTVLRNDYLLLTKDGETMVLAGAEDPNGYADMETPEDFISRIREEVPGDPYMALLYHRNDAHSQWAALDVDAVLSGHGHGGVIRLPLIGGLLGTDRAFFPDNDEGLYTLDRTTMAVSRGLGGVRLWNRPHLPTIVLKKG